MTVKSMTLEAGWPLSTLTLIGPVEAPVGTLAWMLVPLSAMAIAVGSHTPLNQTVTVDTGVGWNPLP
jgi:hypothetical protein